MVTLAQRTVPIGGLLGMRFNLLAVFWCTAGAGFIVEHLVSVLRVSEAPSLWRLVWVVTFLAVWASLGQFWIRMRL